MPNPQTNCSTTSFSFEAFEGQRSATVCEVCPHDVITAYRKTTREQIDETGDDVILDDLVASQMAMQGDIPCKACANSVATNICLDCRECLCNRCCSRHVSKNDHASKALGKVSDARSRVTEKRPGKAAAEEPTVGAGSLNQEILLIDTEELEARKALEQMDSITTQLKDAEVPMGLEELKEKLKMKHQHLAAYSCRLPTVPNVSTMAGRLRRVREECRPPSRRIIDALRSQTSSFIRIWDVTRNVCNQGFTDPGMSLGSPEYRQVVQGEQILVCEKHEPEQGRRHRGEIETMHATTPTTEDGFISTRDVATFILGKELIESHDAATSTNAAGSDSDSDTQDDETRVKCSVSTVRETTQPKELLERPEERDAEVVQVNIERVGNLYVYVAPEGSFTNTENIRAPVIAEVAWDRLQEAATTETLEAARQAAEEKVQDAERELRREKRRGEKKMRSLAEGYIALLDKTQEDNAEALNRMARQLADEQRAYYERLATLRYRLNKEKAEGEKRLKNIRKDFEEKRRRQEENTMSFVLKLEERDRQLLAETASRLDRTQLPEVLQRLFHEHNIRLLGVDCGLNFLLDAPTEQWVSVVEHQLEVQALLEELLPDDVRQRVRWKNATKCENGSGDVDLRLGKPLPVTLGNFRLVLLGRKKVGKSSTGNTILGEKKFVHGPASTTVECQHARAQRSGYLIEVVDTPGLYDTYDASQLRELIRGLDLLFLGPHAILYLIRLDHRFTDMDYQSYLHFKTLFGMDMTKYMIVVFIGGDKLRGTIEELLSRAPERVGQILSECGDRYVVFDNMAYNKQPQVEQLLEMVRDLVGQNGGGFFPFSIELERRLQEVLTQRMERETEKTNSAPQKDTTCSVQ